MEQNIFFYRDKDRNCEQVYFLIKNNGFLNYFKCINVETSRINLPIKAIPALLIYKLKQILYGNDIFIFLNNLIQQNNIQQQRLNLMKYSINNSIKPATNNQQNIQLQNNQIKQNIQQQNLNNSQQQNKSHIIGYIESEMNGFSDNYTFSSPDINIAPQHNFTGSNEEVKIYTGNDNNKIKTSDTMKTINKIKELRLNESKQLKELQFKSQQNKQNQEDIKQINNKINEFVKRHQEASINNN